MTEQPEEWQPIATAPRDGSPILAAWTNRTGFDQATWCRLAWKHNRRTGRDYFGDEIEMDDYELADDQPTHWLPIPPLPVPET